MSILFYKRLSNFAYPLRRATKGSVGFDLQAAVEVIINAHSRALVATDLAIQLPAGTYGRIAPKSGLAVKAMIDVGAGVIDSDYRGNVKVLLINNSCDSFAVWKGDQIAQLIVERAYMGEAEMVDSLEETERGEGGFGSTGLKRGASNDDEDDEVKKLRLDEEREALAEVDNYFHP